MNEHKIPNYWEGRCFGCSTSNSHGLKLEFWLSEAGCFTHCTIPDHLCGVEGMAHGGIISLLLDEVAEWTIISRLGQMGLTRELLVRFLKPVPTNTQVRVEGVITEQEGANLVLRSTIQANDGTLLAEGESKWLIPKVATLAKIAGVEEQFLQTFLDHYPVVS